MRLSIVMGLSLALLAGACGCKKQGGSSSSSGDILIGEYASLTGDTATFGVSSHNGLMLAIEQINSAGGVLGRKIALRTEDDGSKANQAVTAAKKLISQDGVVAVIGEVASKCSLAVAPTCQKQQVPMLSPASTNPDVTVENGKVKPWIFRICFTDDFQGRAGAQWARDNGWKRVAVLTDEDQDYSKGLARVFEESYGGHGQIVSNDSYRGSDTEFRSQLTRIARQHPDAVYLPGYYTQVGMIVRQAREVGLKVPFFGGDGWDSDLTLAEPAAQGDYYSDHFTAEDPSPRVQAFVKAYRAKYGSTPDAMAVLGYDAGGVIAQAIRDAGKVDRAAIRDALAKITNYPGASGSITIDKNHNARKPIVILQIKDHKAVLAKTYTNEELMSGK
ncbi:MAG TPA: ABC transporter substrate-binding protein [Tepidisphaeraceae bacterium]|nr:ABC transporter substrate-binding protein [Tepidisphaeraceae bacterium]